MPMYLVQDIVVKADTIEGLAQKLGMPEDNFVKNVARYNELYDKQQDEAFGKEVFCLSALLQPPEGIGGYFICTLDGIRIVTNMTRADCNIQKDGCSFGSNLFFYAQHGGGEGKSKSFMFPLDMEHAPMLIMYISQRVQRRKQYGIQTAAPWQ